MRRLRLGPVHCPGSVVGLARCLNRELRTRKAATATPAPIASVEAMVVFGGRGFFSCILEKRCLYHDIGDLGSGLSQCRSARTDEFLDARALRMDGEERTVEFFRRPMRRGQRHCSAPSPPGAFAPRLPSYRLGKWEGVSSKNFGPVCLDNR